MLKIDIEYKKGVLFLRLIGKLNSETRDELLKILEMTNTVGFKYIMFNFEKLYSIDEEALTLIRNISKKILSNEGRILTCGYNNMIKLKLEKSKINNYVVETSSEIGAFSLINI